MKRFQSLIPILTLIAIVLVSFSASCDRRNPPPIMAPEAPEVDPGDVLIIHKISASPDTIYADYNITYSTISVEVRNGEGFGVPDQIVKFKSHPIGRMLTTVRTDSTGIATSTFWDDGESGIATITAIVRKYHESVSDSVISADTLSTIVVVEETPVVTDVTLHFERPADPFPMKVGQVTPIYATALNSTGHSVSDGTKITFQCLKGKFQDAEGNDLGQHVTRSTFNGRATTLYNAGTSATTNPDSQPEIVTAKIGNISNSRNISIRPGSPFNIELRSLVQVDGVDIPADTSHVGSTNHIYMETVLSDMYNNTCQSQNVKFSTDLGSFMNTTQDISIPTNEYGVARVRFTPGLFAGAATIGATANNDTLSTQIIFTITSDDIHSIDFTQLGQIKLNVANTGGTQSAVLRVKLRDINGNLIDKPQQVYFRIMNGPGSMPAGANLNNFAPTDSVGVISNGGEAQVSVNAGTESGVLVIRASCTTEEGKWIQASKPNILITAGPPFSVVPFIGGFNTGTDMGGGVWRVIAGAHVRDRWNNPVQDATSVQFSLYGENAGPGYTPPTNAQIESQSYVGNVSANGDSLSGVAYTVITYNGVMTNEIITIHARSGDGIGNSVDNYANVVLPLNDPRFEIQVIPQFVNFGATNPASKEADILVALTDGQGLPITGSEIILVSSRGQIILHPLHYNSPQNPTYNQVPPNYRDISYPHKITTYESYAHARIKVYLDEFPYGDDQTNTPSTTDVGITGRLIGTNVQATTNLLVYRYPGNPPF